jgi:hypothetical protein
MTSIGVTPDYGSYHQRSTALYTKTADELLVGTMPAGNKTRPAEGGWHACGSFQQEGNTGYLSGRCAETRISALQRGNRSLPNRDWRQTWLVLEPHRGCPGHHPPKEQNWTMYTQPRRMLGAKRDLIQ